MNRALLITWYDLPEGKEAEHLSWVKERYVPRMLERRGVAWGAPGPR